MAFRHHYFSGSICLIWNYLNFLSLVSLVLCEESWGTLIWNYSFIYRNQRKLARDLISFHRNCRNSIFTAYDKIEPLKGDYFCMKQEESLYFKDPALLQMQKIHKHRKTGVPDSVFHYVLSWRTIKTCLSTTTPRVDAAIQEQSEPKVEPKANSSWASDLALSRCAVT